MSFIAPKASASTSARGYGVKHQRERQRWKPTVQAGRAVCVRCGRPISPDQPGQPTGWHLDHTDDRQGYRGPAHAKCNLNAAHRKGAQVANAKRRQRRTRRQSRDW